MYIGAAVAKSLQSCPTQFDLIDGSPPGSPVPGILQARTLEWAPISFSSACMHAKVLQSCPTLYNPIDGSPPGSSGLGILQAGILEWVAISFSSACMHAKSLQSYPTVWPYGQQTTRLLCPQDSPGKNTGYISIYIIYICIHIMVYIPLYYICKFISILSHIIGLSHVGRI